MTDRMVQLALDNGFVTPAQVAEARKQQALLTEQGVASTLLTLLEERGDLNAGHVSELRRLVVSDHAEGLVVDGWELTGRLGRGGMGDVFLGVRDGREAAVKRATWSELAAGLLAPAPATRTTLNFVTPTTFRSHGNYLPLPVPQLVFGGLLERWQTWSPVDLGAGAGAALEGIVVRRHRLASVAVQLRGLVPGFVGAAEFELRSGGGPYGGLLGVLARFARFAGVGAKVSTGFGCVDVTTVAGRPASRARDETGDRPGRGD